jgi:glutamate-ammonia-ligase adenylyltransferase
MGKLGSREMTAASDLDLLIVYDADPASPGSDGRRPLAPSRYYTRLTQRLIAALTAATRRGTLYGVDMRLRPSGSQGPLATRFSAFAQYHEAEAETWERMALTRARVVAGDARLAERVGLAIRDILARPPSPELGRDVSALRALVESGKPHAGPWDLKLAPGGQLDLEFLAQYLVLRHARERPELIGLCTEAVLEAAEGLLPDEMRSALGAAAGLYTDVTQLLRLAVDGPFDPAQAGKGLRRRLAAAAGLPDLATLERHIGETRTAVRAIFDAVLSEA